MSGFNYNANGSSSAISTSGMFNQLTNQMNQSNQLYHMSLFNQVNQVNQVNQFNQFNQTNWPLRIQALRKDGREDVLVTIILTRELQERGLGDVTSLSMRRESAERQLAAFRHAVGGRKMNIDAWTRYRHLKRDVNTVKELQAKLEELRQIVEIWVANGVNP